MNEPTGRPYKSGFVSLIGKPNVGKSTLVNTIVGQKVSIVSNKPQTTRRRVLGIHTTDDYQIAFIDTPGIHDAHTQLGKAMVEQARSALGDIDVIVYVADGSHHPGEGDRQIAALIKQAAPEVRRLLCMNKMDQLKAEDVLRNVNAYREILELGEDDFMLTTATRGQNVPKLVDMIVERLPSGDRMFPEDEFTDQSSRFMVAEFVREKILHATRQEVPYSVAVMVDEWEDGEDLIRISATILVEKSSQRAILIGKGGQFLKKVGTSAREEIEEMLESKVFLQLHVKVAEDWRQSPRMLQELEYSE
jgi:GTPase